MVASLSKQLQEEKEARKKLEGELQQLHKVSSEINRKLTEKAQWMRNSNWDSREDSRERGYS